MKRRGTYRPTIEDAVELSGIETLHPGGAALTRRTAEVTRMAPGVSVLDVSCGRGTQSLLYAEQFGCRVTGIDLAQEMVDTARERAAERGMEDAVEFLQGDSQALPFEDARFDVVVNECAVGIPDDSQKVLDEMARVVRPGGTVAIHESTWATALSDEEKDELAERYGTTPLEHAEWVTMLERAGLEAVRWEIEPWSRPENFWQVRQGRDVSGPGSVLTLGERLATFRRIARAHGLRGIRTVMRNEKVFFRAVRAGKIGYGLYWARRPAGPGEPASALT